MPGRIGAYAVPGCLNKKIRRIFRLITPTGAPEACAASGLAYLSQEFVLQNNFFRLKRGIMPVLCFIVISLLFLALCRLGLYFWQREHVPDGYFLYVMLQGLRVDFATLCMLYALPALALVFAAVPGLKKTCCILTFILLPLILAFLVMNEAATPAFMLEYGARPNHIYVAYLKYPKEVFSTLLNGHPAALAGSIICICLTLWLGFKLAKKLFAGYEPLHLKGSVAAFILILLIVPAGVRSSTGHRPLNPSMVSFCESALGNSLPLNSSYSAIYAFRHQTPELSRTQIYDFTPEEQTLASLAAMSAGKVEPLNAQCPINRRVVPVYKGKPKNVVIVIEESLGSDYVESHGGLPMTPNLEKLKEEGWWFNKLYAAGNRSVRGLEAITAGYPPSPLSSTVKIDDMQQDQSNLANVFKAAGYQTAFIYGGESHFDNMASYFRGNGTRLVIDERDYEDPVFKASWGVSDEDLFNRAIAEMTKWHEEQKPFYALIFTSSFHDPFEIPEGRVSLDGFVNNSKWSDQKLLAAKYSDWAVNDFIKKVQASPLWEDTLFLIIADHESNVSGAAEFPLYDMHVPALLLGKDVAPRFDDRLVSQIDFAPTLLSLAGIGGSFPYVGQDLNRDDIVERAPMNLYQVFAYRQKDKLAVLQPRYTSYFYDTHDKDEELTPAAADTEFLDLAAGVLNLGPLIYEKKYSRMDCVKLDSQALPFKDGSRPENRLH